MASALFACTKCNSRHPFEELTADTQICKGCKSSMLVVKCTYCRAEFQQNDNGDTNSLCLKCDQNVKAYGKPTNCEYCSILAAFIGDKCQRCANSEKKWGPPKTCEQCKQRCAFERPDKTQIDGKLLCWLCTLSYKRVLAKARKQREENQPHLRKQEHTTQHKDHHHSNHSKQRRISSSTSATTKQHSSSREHSSKHHRKSHDLKTHDQKSHHHHKSKTHHGDKKSHDHQHASNKKPKLEKSSSNGMTPISSQPKSNDSLLNDLTSSHHVIAVSQLHEEVESLKKVLQQKEQLIMEKDKQLTALKAEIYESGKQMRDRVSSLQKQHIEQNENIQTKTRLVQKLQKQVAELQKKANKKGASSLSHVTNSPLLISGSSSPLPS